MQIENTSLNSNVGFVCYNAKHWYLQCTREKRENDLNETRHVSIETRRISQEGGNLHLSGTVNRMENTCFSLSFLPADNQSKGRPTHQS